MTIKIVSIVGARPQFIKAAAVSKAILHESSAQEVIVHTGQHYDQKMSEVFFSELGIPQPEYNLAVNGGHHGEMTSRMLSGVENILLSEKPDVVIVYGDTNSTLAGALAASKLKMKIAHVEAGLRSYNKAMPEEINRVLTDHMSDVLFCPTPDAVRNLNKEGIRDGVFDVGDVMFDATLAAKEIASQQSNILSQLGLGDTSYDLATIHRAENTESHAALEEVVDYLRKRAEERLLIMPLHPRTASTVEKYNISLEPIRTIDPVGFLDMTQLLSNCVEVYTDSGGLQKEAYFHRKQCTTLRSETEWVETISCGWNRLWKQGTYAERKDITVYGDGNASAKVVDVLMERNL